MSDQKETNTDEPVTSNDVPSDKDTKLNKAQTAIKQENSKLTKASETRSKSPKKAIKSASYETKTDVKSQVKKTSITKSTRQTESARSTSTKTSDFKLKAVKKPKKPTKHDHLQPKIKDHFVVRRSSRKTSAILEKERSESFTTKLLSKDESGLESVNIEGKGKGVIASRPFNKGELICEYSGVLITHDEATKREEDYKKDTTIGCYMYYFQYKDRRLCIDATKDNGRFGRLVNHSKTSSNVIVKVFPIDDDPYLCLIAKRNIEIGEELQYDYGERDKDIIASHPWLIA